MRDKAKGYVYIFLTTVIFSTMEVALKMVSGVFAPMQITVLRFFIGGVCIFPFAVWTLRRKGMKLAKRDFWYMAFTGMLCVPTSMVLYQLAVSSTLASVVAVVFSGNPIFVVPLAWLLFHEVIHKNNLVALLFIVAGILAIADPLHNQLSPVGVLLAVLAAVLFSFYLLLSRPITRKYGGMVTTCGSFLFGSLELFVLLLIGWTGPGARFFGSVGLDLFCQVPFLEGINLSTLPYFLYICIVNSAMGFVCHQLALLYTDAKTVGLVFFFKPALAPLLAWLVLRETVEPNMLLGIAFFLIGSLVSLVPDMIRERKEARQNRA